MTPEGEDAVEALLANRDLLEVYADPAALKATIADGGRTIRLYVAGVFAAL